MDHKDLLNEDLQLTNQTQKFLIESARWGKFLSILGFIFIGLMAILSVLVPSFLASIPPYNKMEPSTLKTVQAVMAVVYFALAVLYFFPCLFLNRFSSRTIKGIKQASQVHFEEGLSNLKSMFKFFGILTIVILSLYVLFFLGLMIAMGLKG